MRYIVYEQVRNPKTGVVINIEFWAGHHGRDDMKNYRVAIDGSELFFASNWGAYQKAAELAGIKQTKARA